MLGRTGPAPPEEWFIGQSAPQWREQGQSASCRCLTQSRQRLRSKGQHDRAIQDFDQAIKVNPQYASAYNGRAWAHHKKGEDAKGLPDAEKAVALAPKDAASIETRAEIYEMLGQRDKALADYRAALSLTPKMKSAEDGLKRLGDVH